MHAPACTVARMLTQADAHLEAAQTGSKQAQNAGIRDVSCCTTSAVNAANLKLKRRKKMELNRRFVMETLCVVNSSGPLLEPFFIVTAETGLFSKNSISVQQASSTTWAFYVQYWLY